MVAYIYNESKVRADCGKNGADCRNANKVVKIIFINFVINKICLRKI